MKIKFMQTLKYILVVSMLFWGGTTMAEITFGNTSGKITLIEYFDYNCPMCRSYAAVIDEIAKRNTDVKVIQRVVPVFAANSLIIDRIVLASFYQHKFSAMQKEILKLPYPEAIPLKGITPIIKKLGLNQMQLVQDTRKPAITKHLEQNAAAFQKLGKRRIPITVVYTSNHPEAKKILVGMQTVGELQKVINAIESAK